MVAIFDTIIGFFGSIQPRVAPSSALKGQDRQGAFEKSWAKRGWPNVSLEVDGWQGPECSPAVLDHPRLGPHREAADHTALRHPQLPQGLQEADRLVVEGVSLVNLLEIPPSDGAGAGCEAALPKALMACESRRHVWGSCYP